MIFIPPGTSLGGFFIRLFGNTFCIYEYMVYFIQRLKFVENRRKKHNEGLSNEPISVLCSNYIVPEYVIMPGIAAGTKNITDSGTQEFGDVLLANAVWNYSNGKYVSPHQAEIVFGEIGFNPRPTMVKIAGEHLTEIQKYLRSGRSEFYVHSGPLASGTAVVANTSIIKKQINSSFKDTEGVEMEGYGVAYAVSHALNPKPHTIIAKSVCDFADERKNDIYQKFAAYTSCGFIKELLENVLTYTGE